jgi:hypothetical protein
MRDDDALIASAWRRTIWRRVHTSTRPIRSGQHENLTFTK